ncbi:DUF5994 family protein [Streptacidiphilus anmyonensis]|uniref:DUF5994 family protein n=1 Tax=Streptacidiphilus anmyonensis TaxID=405782 RepID=UPI0006942C1C|nr:DUF5994 family protein [Streptacidiphilus anmyonensis]
MTTHTTPAPATVSQAPPPLRLSLTPDGPPSRLDGAWWPYSRNLFEQLPGLIAELDGIWGRITRAAVHDAVWTELRHSLPAGTHDVRVNWYDPGHDPHTITVSSYRIREWELLVVPPESAPWRAKQLMAAAARPGNQQSARALVTDGPGRPLATAPRDHIHIRTRHTPTTVAGG